MARIVFTANIQRHVACPEAEAAGRTVREVLENVFAEIPQARGYVLDDQAALRKHMAIFVDGQIIRDRARLTDAVSGTESLPRRQTDPAWLQDHFLGTGHDEATRNATFTFIKRRGRHYAVTCRHVMEAVADPKMVPAAKYPTIAIHIDKAVLNLSYLSAQGLVLDVYTPGAETKRKEVDVALAQLDGSYWNLLTGRKNKVAIDLDMWHEPHWNSVKYCLAAGYRDEHKLRVGADDGEKVANQLTVVVAEVSSCLARTQRIIALSSILEQPHGYYFSGMSGGPVYAVEGHEQREVEDKELFPIGIIFQGFPSGGRPDAQESRDAASAFLTDRDLFFRALTLTPEIFDEWLQKAGFDRQRV